MSTPKRSSRPSRGRPGSRRPGDVRDAGHGHPANRSPGLLVWTVALLGTVFPIAGTLAGLVGLWRLWQSEPRGGVFLLAGAVCFVLDILIDVWMYRTAALSPAADAATLNARGARHIGHTAVLDRPIVGGRGRLRLGDTFWAVSGVDCPEGTRVRITGAKGSVLSVERVPAGD